MTAPFEDPKTFKNPLGPQESRSWPRRLIKISFLLLGPLILFLVFYFYNWFLANQDLQEAIAEIDRFDPNWHLNNLLAHRPPIPAKQNSANIVLSVDLLFGGNFPPPQLFEQLQKFPPPVLLPADVAQNLQEKLKPLGPAVIEARKLAKFPRGHFHLVYTPDFISTLTEDIQKIRKIGGLLELDCRWRVQKGDLEGAWISAAAILNAGKSIGDEPMIIPQFIRMAQQSLTVTILERILAQGEVPVPALAKMRQALEEETFEPLFQIGIRGERAGLHQLFGNLENGSLSLTSLSGKTGKNPHLLDRVNDFFTQSKILRSHAWLLRYWTRAVEASKISSLDQYRSLDDLDEWLRTEDRELKIPALALIGLPGITKFAEAERWEDTLLACAMVALAAEQFRLTRQRWPKSLNELVKAGLLIDSCAAHLSFSNI